MNCPHCGAEWKGWRGMWDCDSFPSGKDGAAKRTDACFERQIAQLKADLAKANAMLSEQTMIRSAMSEFYNRVKGDLEFAEQQLSQCVRRDDPRLQESVMCAWKIMERISVQERAACAQSIKSNIQSIIEGK